MTENLHDVYEKVADNLKIVEENIQQAAYKAHRKIEDIRLLGATKTVPANVINFAISQGLNLIGENRVQELLAKYDSVDISKCDVHFIGTLQTNKVKYIVDKVNLIHSVGSLKLAREISKQAEKIHKVQDILLEVNIANENSKGGFIAEEIVKVVEEISELHWIKVQGLMCIPPVTEDSYASAKYFEKIRNLSIDIGNRNIDNVNMCCLSMGMSQDYQTAIAFGANIIRVGSAIFGSRRYP